MASPLLLLFLLSQFVTISPSSAQDGGGTPPSFIPSTTTSWSHSVGVTYNLSIPNLPDPKLVAKALADRHVPLVRLVDPDPAAISAFSKTDIDVYISIDDEDLLVSFAKDNISASNYLSSHIVPALPSLKLSSISIGNGVFVFNRNISNLVLPAVSRMYNACQVMGLKNVTVTSAHSGFLIAKPFPPSEAAIDSTVTKPIKELLEFYSTTGGSFLIDLYPYSVYAAGSLRGLTLDFTTFKAKDEKEKLQDPLTRVLYDNLFEVMVDSVVAVISSLGHHMMPITVVATGWPWVEGDPPEGGAARDYNQGLINVLNTIAGTPLRMTQAAPKVYIMGLFDRTYSWGTPFNGSFALWNSTIALEERYHLDFASYSPAHLLRRGSAARFLFFLAPVFVAWTLVQPRAL